MKQLLQSARNGEQEVAEVPVPRPAAGQVLVRTAASLVSAGTERMAMEFARMGLLDKARARPDLVRQVLSKARNEGVLTALNAAQNRLDQPQSLGYSSAGTVVEMGAEVTGFTPGDRVACAGAGYAVHAEFCAVPKNLVARIPAGARVVSFEEAAFTTVGAIAMHGFRLTEAQVGETVAVIGLGLIGLLALQVARAAGCQVIGMDPDAQRCRLAEQLGCAATAMDEEAFAALCHERTSGRGADAVLITAATDSDAPVELAGRVARERARVVATGAVGTHLPRRVYYDKELEFRISRSYGPGRYDPEFEERGRDYPAAYVRWTETRNMEAFLQLVADGRVEVAPLITHRFTIEQATAAYELIGGESRQPFLGVVITYSNNAQIARKVSFVGAARAASGGKTMLGVIGAGNFAKSVLIPAFREVEGLELTGICAASGVSAKHAGDKFGFRYCCTDLEQVLGDAGINTVAIATRHHLHASQVVAALEAGKDVFCEKPLALNETELGEVADAAARSGRMLMVGFNRRFSPLAQEMRKFFDDLQGPRMLQYRINAGFIPANHWTQVAGEGGGRIIGEVCHFVDFAGWFLKQRPLAVEARALPDAGMYAQDNVLLTLEYSDGSLAQITYVANGAKGLGKERVEAHAGGRSAVLDDFRSLELIEGTRRTEHRSRLRQDKGHRHECAAFVAAVRGGGERPISLDDMLATTRATFAAVESLRTGARVALDSSAAS